MAVKGEINYILTDIECLNNNKNIAHQDLSDSLRNLLCNGAVLGVSYAAGQHGGTYCVTGQYWGSPIQLGSTAVLTV